MPNIIISLPKLELNDDGKIDKDQLPDPTKGIIFSPEATYNIVTDQIRIYCEKIRYAVLKYNYDLISEKEQLCLYVSPQNIDIDNLFIILKDKLNPYWIVPHSVSTINKNIDLLIKSLPEPKYININPKVLREREESRTIKQIEAICKATIELEDKLKKEKKTNDKLQNELINERKDKEELQAKLENENQDKEKLIVELINERKDKKELQTKLDKRTPEKLSLLENENLRAEIARHITYKKNNFHLKENHRNRRREMIMKMVQQKRDKKIL